MKKETRILDVIAGLQVHPVEDEEKAEEIGSRLVDLGGTRTWLRCAVLAGRVRNAYIAEWF